MPNGYGKQGCLSGSIGSWQDSASLRAGKRLTSTDETLTAFVPIDAGSGVNMVWKGLRDEEVRTQSKQVQSLYLPAPRQLDRKWIGQFDVAIYFSVEPALAGIYPALDTLHTDSKYLTPETVSEEHYRVARGVCSLLWQASEIESRTFGTESVSNDDARIVSRARRVRRFLSQPMYVAEAWTGQRAATVPMVRTVRDFSDLLEGVYDDFAEDAFMMAGKQP